jgi:succinate dehydrogenase / fumarate reductase cytochrome b subunit
MPHRPLSPHVFIYRFAYTMATSIFHRATGLALSAGLLLLVSFLIALASGPESYAGFLGFASSWPVKALLSVVVLSFCYHFANGIRHLLWDAGIGMERKAARMSARLVVVLALLAAGGLLFLFFSHGATP